jgi:hypothetical protein
MDVMVKINGLVSGLDIPGESSGVDPRYSGSIFFSLSVIVSVYTE